MRICASTPGRFGDIAWALPTVRALAQVAGEPVDFLISGKYGSIAPLIRLQPYIRECYVLEDWLVQETAPMTPRIPPRLPVGPYDRVVHLGYQSWPASPLPMQIHAIAVAQGPVGPLDLQTPWITLSSKKGWERRVCCGWSDEHFELKAGLTQLVKYATPAQDWGMGSTWHLCVPLGSRWLKEAGPIAGSVRDGESWEVSAQWIAGCRVFFGCCSALHVLARALGKPVVMMEPNPQRHNAIFYPSGTTGHGVELVLGNDGKPTFDSRHCADALREALRAW